jgi:hypothetical protein
MTKKLLICGSRHASTDLIKKAITLTQKAISKNIAIICGDADGIDETVINVCNAQKYANITVYGAKNHRRKTEFGSNEVVYGSYTKRDVVMVNNAHKVVCVWNGTSKGTKRNYDHALKSKKHAVLIEDPRKAKVVELLPDSPKCKVINKQSQKKSLSNTVYIGRPRHKTNEHYGNPFSHKKGTKAMVMVRDRDEAVQLFDYWLSLPFNSFVDKIDVNLQVPGWFDKLKSEEDRRQWILSQIPILANRIKKTKKDLFLACWCSPKACHGDVLASKVNDLLK